MKSYKRKYNESQQKAIAFPVEVFTIKYMHLNYAKADKQSENKNYFR
jgi:hypothetical protein